MLKIVPTVVSSGRGQCLPDDAIAMFDMHDKEPARTGVKNVVIGLVARFAVDGTSKARC